MGIVAAEGLGYHVAGSDHGPIHVDRQPRQVEPLQLVVDEFAIQGDQRLERFLGELLESVNTTVRSVGMRARPQSRVTAGTALHGGDRWKKLGL